VEEAGVKGNEVLKSVGIIILILFGAWAGNEVQKQNTKRAIYEIQQEQNRAGKAVK